MCALRDAAPRLEEAGIRVVAISLDDVATQKRFSAEHELAYPLLSDPDGSAARKFGVLAPGGRFARRVSFVLDPEGIVRHVDTAVDVIRHGADLVAVIRGLRGEVEGR